MFDLSVLNGLETVGSFIVYKDTFAFVIEPDQTGERLGVMLIEQKDIDYDMKMYAGVHLSFLNRLIEDNNKLMNRLSSFI